MVQKKELAYSIGICLKINAITVKVVTKLICYLNFNLLNVAEKSFSYVPRSEFRVPVALQELRTPQVSTERNYLTCVSDSSSAITAADR